MEDDTGVEMELNPQLSHTVLSNPLILQKVFSFLNNDTLKCLRLVNKTWGSESIKHFDPNKVIIRIQSSRSKPPKISLAELTQFFTQYKIRHTLHISLCHKPWLCDTKDDLSQDDDAAKVKLYTGGKGRPNPIQLFDYLKTTGSLVSCLRLETIQTKEEDAATLSKILMSLTSLETLYLDFVTYTTEGLLASINGASPSIRKLGLRFQEYEAPHTSNTISVECFTNLFKTFDTVTTLDLTPSTRATIASQKASAWEMCMKALSSLEENSTIRGLWADVIACGCCRTTFWTPFLALTRPLVDLHIFAIGESEDLECIRKLIGVHAGTLATLEFIWAPNIKNCDCDEEAVKGIKLPSLPKLKKLSMLSMNDVEPEKGCVATKDAFCLRDLLLDGAAAFQRTFPSLTHLTLAFYTDLGPRFWKHLIPDKDTDGVLLEIRQIQFLEVTQAAQCDSVCVLRLNRIFPGLITLRHPRLDRKEDIYRGCLHKSGKRLEFPVHHLVEQLPLWVTKNLPTDYYSGEWEPTPPVWT